MQLYLLGWLMILSGTGVSALYAQRVISFSFYDSVTVLKNNQLLFNAWAGGLNSPQFSSLDFNSDGNNDLIVFDRAAGKFSTFLNVNKSYRYAPEYEELFPKAESWCLLVDYNGDGKKDLLTASDFGVKVFQNITPAGGKLTWALRREYLETKGFSGFAINLKVDRTDIPALTDVDNDGDMDILTFAPITGSSIEYHKNMSREKFGHSDSLVFEKTDDRWGQLEECGQCNSFLFGNNYCRVTREEHAGSTLLALDLDGDLDKDLLVGDVSCPNITAFINKGSLQQAVFNSFTPAFPSISPVQIGVFPATYYEDVDFDGLPDLLAAPNTPVNDGNVLDFRQSSWFYKNRGTAQSPDFLLVQKDFLQQQMIETGEYARPAFTDADGDGDPDMFISNRGQRYADGSFKASVSYFENTGTSQRPAFRLADEDYLRFSDLTLSNLKISFADVNQDNVQDMVFSAVRSNNTVIWGYLPNTAKANATLALNLSTLQTPAVTLNPLDEPLFYDLDNDQDADLLVGRAQGGLAWYENTGKLSLVLRVAGALGIADHSSRQTLSLAIADLDGDNEADLLTGDRTGTLTAYMNFRNQLNGLATGNTALITSENRIINYSFGREIYPAVYRNDIVVGTVAGGVRYLRSNNVVNGSGDDSVKINPLKVYPNPATEQFVIQSDQTGEVEIYTVSGKRLLRVPRLVAGQAQTVSLQNWLPGIYLLKLTTAHGSFIRKVIVGR